MNKKTEKYKKTSERKKRERERETYLKKGKKTKRTIDVIDFCFDTRQNL